MPPRLSLRPLARQCYPCGPQSRATISSTAKNESLKDIAGSPNASIRLFKQDGSSASDKLANMDDEGKLGGEFNGPSPNDPYAPTAYERLHSLMDRTNAKSYIAEKRKETHEKALSDIKRNEIAQQQTRRWKPGDVYAPHDLSPAEMLKWRQPRRPTRDIIDVLGLNPLDHYRNPSIIAEFITEMGRIKHSNDTGLRPVNQRKMAKTIRRAIGMGIHPSTHVHPMIIFGDPVRRSFSEEPGLIEAVRTQPGSEKDSNAKSKPR